MEDKNDKGEFVSIAKMMGEFFKADQILKRKVSKSGSGGHISVPPEYIGSTARVFLHKEKKEKEVLKEENTDKET